jgi:hypothetical protein
MTILYDKNGNEYKVPHQIDVIEWLRDGYTLEKPQIKSKKTKED